MKLRGILLTVFSSLWFSSAAMLIKGLGPDVPAVWVVCLRNALAFPVVWWLLRREGLPLASRNWPRLGLRAILALLAMITNFWALPRMPLANNTLLNQTAPLFAVLWGILFFGERPSRSAMACTALAFVGVYVTLRPSFAGALLPALMALCAGLTASLAFATLRSIAQDEPHLRILAYFTGLGGAAMLPWVLSSGWLPDARQLLMLAATAACATIGQFFLTAGLRDAPVSLGSVGTLFSLVVGVGGGWAFWGEVPDPWTWTGCLLIGGGIAGVMLDSRRARTAIPID